MLRATPFASCSPSAAHVFSLFNVSKFTTLYPYVYTRVARPQTNVSLGKKHAHHTKLRMLSHKGTANTFCNPNNACVDKMT